MFIQSILSLVLVSSNAAVSSYVCKTSDRIEVLITFQTKSHGKIDVTSYNDILPLTLVKTDFTSSPTGHNQEITSEKDGEFSRRATVTIPAEPREGATFSGTLRVDSTGAPSINRTLKCNDR